MCACVPVVTTVNPTKTEKPIEVPFGIWTRVGPNNHVSGWGLGVLGVLRGPKEGQFGRHPQPIVKYKEYPARAKVTRQVAAAMRPVAVSTAATCIFVLMTLLDCFVGVSKVKC